MRLKRISIQFAMICGLAVFSRGLLPAPMCPDCKTPGAFNTYIANLGHSQTGTAGIPFLQVLWLSIKNLL